MRFLLVSAWVVLTLFWLSLLLAAFGQPGVQKWVAELSTEGTAGVFAVVGVLLSLAFLPPFVLYVGGRQIGWRLARVDRGTQHEHGYIHVDYRTPEVSR